MRVDLPVNVKLRGKQFGRVTQVSSSVYPFYLQGRSSEGTPELWHRDGHWRDDKTPSPFDIVAVVDADGIPVPLTNQFSRK